MKNLRSESNLPRSSRRQFLRRAAGGAAAFAVPATPLFAEAEPVAATAPACETLVKTLFESLNPAQREALVFPFEHELRHAVDNNWHITPKEPAIGGFLSADQQQMVRGIFLNIPSEEYRDEVMRQVEQDNGRAGFGGSNIAIFGEPGTGKPGSTSSISLSSRTTMWARTGSGIPGSWRVPT